MAQRAYTSSGRAVEYLVVRNALGCSVFTRLKKRAHALLQRNGADLALWNNDDLER
ncbi:MAG: hypothetical protein M3349_07250 [Actinomycetota bacterium]|nr:hypothetical protein [Actinomycetota bacterium]